MFASLKKQKKGYQKYGVIDPLCDIANIAMKFTADMEKHNNQAYYVISLAGHVQLQILSSRVFLRR